jgi:regulatory protein
LGRGETQCLNPFRDKRDIALVLQGASRHALRRAVCIPPEQQEAFQEGGFRMTVTQIQQTKKGRYSIFGDGEFLFSVHKDIFLLHQELAVGREVSVQRMEEIRLEDEEYSCREKALSLLDYAPQSTGRLREKLERFYPRETAERVVERLEELGLVDDLDYGRRLAADLINLRGWGLARVRQELRRRRLSPETIQGVLEELEDTDETGTILRLVEKKYLPKLRQPRGREKVAAALQRRGYSWTQIREAFSRLGEDELPSGED